MNRDERLDRGAAVPPATFQCWKIAAIYPRDVEGGTWIGANELGVAFALMNWNDVTPLTQKRQSRGFIIPELLGCHSSREVQNLVGTLKLDGVLPFRVIGIWPDSNTVNEFRWDSRQLATEAKPWKPHHWFSSSLSDEEAAEKRGATCRAAGHDLDAGSLAWTRKLHRSHDAGAGAFSICVHREQVQTASYTELICTPNTVECNYAAGNPCQAKGTEQKVSIGRSTLPSAMTL
jgi:hypothetical protein